MSMESYSEPPKLSFEDDERATLLDDSIQLQDTKVTHRVSPKRDRNKHTIIVVALLLMVAVADICSIAYIGHIFRTVYKDEGTADLPLGNPYVGLRALYKSGKVNSSRIEGHHIINKARVVAPVYSKQPDKITPDDELRANKRYGTLTPHERHFHVDSKTDTLVQFRVIDFGMEECSLMLRLPGIDEHVEGPHSFSLRPSSQLEICQLDTTRALDTTKLTWRTRPKCKQGERLSIAAETGRDVKVTQFPCAWGSYQTFEVSCASPGSADCQVDIWTSQNQTWGMFLYQHQTV